MRTTTVLLLLLAFVAPAAASPEKDPLPEPTRQYLEARRLLYVNDLPSAVELFERVVKEHPGSDVADDCLYWAAYCRIRLPDGRPRAVEAWLRLLKRHPASPWLDEAAAALKESARDRAAEILRAALAKKPEKGVRHRLTDGLAALGFEDVIPALEARVNEGDRSAAIALSRLGTAGAASLEQMLRDDAATAACRVAAYRGWARAVAAEKTVPAERARTLLKAILADPLLTEVRRDARALARSLKPKAEKDVDEEDLAETVRGLRREVADLKKQVAELEALLRKRLKKGD